MEIRSLRGWMEEWRECLEERGVGQLRKFDDVGLGG
jgi:hypothetical protein